MPKISYIFVCLFYCYISSISSSLARERTQYSDMNNVSLGIKTVEALISFFKLTEKKVHIGGICRWIYVFRDGRDNIHKFKYEIDNKYENYKTKIIAGNINSIDGMVHFQRIGLESEVFDFFLGSGGKSYLVLYVEEAKKHSLKSLLHSFDDLQHIAAVNGIGGIDSIGVISNSIGGCYP